VKGEPHIEGKGDPSLEVVGEVPKPTPAPAPRPGPGPCPCPELWSGGPCAGEAVGTETGRGGPSEVRGTVVALPQPWWCSGEQCRSQAGRRQCWE